MIRIFSRIKCVCSNSNPLHYCVLRVPRKVIDGVKCGLFSNHVREKVEVGVIVSVTVCVVLLCFVG